MGWTNGNGNGGTNGNAGGNGNGNNQCKTNNGNGNGNNTSTDVYEEDQYFFHPDHLGSSSYVTDADGEIFQHLEYFPFGETFVEEHSNTQRTPYLFTAKELDEETGLYYFGARYYDPRTSVWQSPDPILAKYLPTPGESASRLAGMGGVFTPVNLNLYAYSHNRPVIMMDPDGRLPIIPVIIGAIWLADKAYAAYEGYQDYKAIQSGEKTLSEVAIERGTEQVAGAALGAFGRWGVKGFNRLRRGARAADDVIDAASRLCSFAPDTLVLTKSGYKRIDEITTEDLVWSRNPASGEQDWKHVLDAYSNRYDETVVLNVRDVETGAEQTIRSNRIHPYFVQVPANMLLHNASTEGEIVPSSEGHVYKGPIANGRWVDAANLQPGFRLLNGDGSWAEVVSVKVQQKPLEAFNLSVEQFHTYFVAGNVDVEPVWVHNVCNLTFGKNALTKFRKHAADIYSTARGNGVSIPKGDWGAVGNYIQDVIDTGVKGNKTPFKWNTEMVNGYVKGDSIVLTKESGEFLTFLDRRRASVYLKNNLNLE